MDVNKFQILRQGGVSKQINIPIELTWDYNGLSSRSIRSHIRKLRILFLLRGVN